jgi:N-acetylneuraminic acid mutarotase
VARHLAAASKALHSAVSEAWGDLARRFPCRLYVVGGINDGYHLVDTVERFDPLLGSWEVLPHLHTARAGPAACELAGRLYVLGGEARGAALKDAQRFDPWTGRWETVPDMHVGRIRAATVVLEGCLYVLGGLDGSKPLSAVERYDPTKKAWEVLASMEKPRYACAAIVKDGKIYAFGGELTDSGVQASIERYDPEAETWELLSAVRPPCCGAAVAVTSNQAFALGGLGLSGQALGVAERLLLEETVADELTEKVPHWAPLPPMPTPRHLASAAPFRGGVVVVGGKGATFDAVGNVELYDPLAMTWEVLPPLSAPRLRAAVVAGRL